jgi:plasmid maintenance system antidote protein VapI
LNLSLQVRDSLLILLPLAVIAAGALGGRPIQVLQIHQGAHILRENAPGLIECVPRQRVNTLIHGKRGITAETAILLSEALDTSPELWLALQTDYDLWHALRKRARAFAPKVGSFRSDSERVNLSLA